MNRVTITLHIDLPDGVVPDVAYGSGTNVPHTVMAGPDEPPLPDAPPPDLFAEAQRVFEDKCPVHHVAWKTVPAGVSKKKVGPGGQPLRYEAFQACPATGCNERPRKSA